jgi:hypothetical protein
VSTKRAASQPRRAKRKKAAALDAGRGRAKKALKYVSANHVIVDHDGPIPSMPRQLELLHAAMDVGAVLQLDGPEGNIVGMTTAFEGDG